MARLVEVATAGEIPVGGRKSTNIDDLEIAIFNVDDEQFYAVEDVCSHDSGPLGEGEITNTYEVECPRHGARFDCASGEALTPPASTPQPSFAVTIENGRVHLDPTPSHPHPFDS